MPRGDRTGPGGRGPRTGRGAGYCTGYPIPGFRNPVPGGRGFRHMYYATGLPGWARGGYGSGPAAPTPFYPPPAEYTGESISAKEKKEFLQAQLNQLNEQAEELKKELDRLEED